MFVAAQQAVQALQFGVFLTLKFTLPICVVFCCSVQSAQVGREALTVHSNELVQRELLVF